MSGNRSRRKGEEGMREVVRILDAAGLGTTFRKRSQADHGARIKQPDIDADDVSLWPYWCEVKRQVRPNIRAALRQAQADCHDGRTPLAMTREDRGEWLVTMTLDDFLIRLLEDDE